MIHYLIQDPPQDPPKWDGVPAPDIDQFGQFPKLASTFHDVDGLFYFTYAVCIFFFVLITGVLLYSVVAHRRKTWDQKPLSNVTHNTPLEVVWTLIPLVLVMIMFAWGFKGSLDMTVVPHEAHLNTYKATAKQWSWQFTYPDGTTSYDEVWVEAGKPVQFILESKDVLHAFYVPAMRVKRDVVPGRYQSAWFEPHFTKEFAEGEPREQTFHLFCAEYCGLDHSRMYAKVHVVDAETMAKTPWNLVPKPEDPIEDKIAYGKQFANAQCLSCHSTNGAPGVGPTWKGLFTKDADGNYVGRQRDVLEGGQKKTITVDDAYILESIKEPMKKLAAEFPNGGMSNFDSLKDDEARLACILAYIKSLADN
ncbi:MAG TPA: cytochrome c oxidase subunit II [bacterium]|nr:cytochrome c oxidase subunit II [bacterium]